jgi:hypothetical protein
MARLLGQAKSPEKKREVASQQRAGAVEAALDVTQGDLDAMEAAVDRTATARELFDGNAAPSPATPKVPATPKEMAAMAQGLADWQWSHSANFSFIPCVQLDMVIAYLYKKPPKIPFRKISKTTPHHQQATPPTHLP